MRNSLIIFIPLIFVGCTATSTPELEFDKPEVQIPKKVPEARKNKGSLYSMQGTSLFADKKDLQIGDIIQIIIDEDTTSKTNNKRELSSDRSTSLGGGTFTSGGSGVVGKAANELNRNLGIRPYDITSDNSINSSQIANLKLLYDKDGVESDILETPWGTKILRSIWPF